MNEGRRNEKEYESHRYQRRPDWRSLRYGQLNRAWNADRYESNPFGEDFPGEDFEEFGFEPEDSTRSPHRERHDQGYGRHAAPDRGIGYKNRRFRNYYGEQRPYEQSVFDHGRYMSEAQYEHERDRGEHYGKGPKGYKRADARIYEEVCDALYHDSHIDARDIEVSVQDGVVTLTGSVSERYMKRLAEDIAEQVTGVHDVKNQINTNFFGRDYSTQDSGAI